MAEASNPWVLETIKVLDPLIKKPKLTEALLSKPPFAYIQALVQNIVESTGYPPNVFSAEDFVASKDHPKEFKIAFITKLVDFVNSTGSASPAKVPKILAGLEPENTNKLLQIFGGLAASSKGSSSAEKPKKKKVKEEKKEEGAKEEKKTSKEKSSKTKEGAKEEKKEKKSSSSTTKKEASKGKSEKKSETSKESSKQATTKKSSKTKEDSKSKTKEEKPKEEDTKEKKVKKVKSDSSKTKEKTKREFTTTPVTTGEQPREDAAELVEEDAEAKKAEPSLNDDEFAARIIKQPARPQTAQRPPPRIQSNVRTVEKVIVDTPSPIVR